MSREVTAEEQEKLFLLFKKAWSAETSARPEKWSSDNPTAGQDTATALVIQDIYGGILVSGTVGAETHYWNGFPELQTDVDHTMQQFKHYKETPEGRGAGAKLEGRVEQSREDVLGLPDAEKQYKLLKKNLEALPEYKEFLDS